MVTHRNWMAAIPQPGAEVVTRSPTIRQRELGKRLRELRNAHDMTAEDVAERLACSVSKISRLEAGVRRPSLRDVRDLCVVYDANPLTSAELMDLARGAREQVWWTQYEDLNLDPYLGLEQDATAITSYTTYYIPALLQTGDYTRAVIKAIAPKMDPKILEQRVEARMRRQLVLTGDHPPRYSVLLDEAVLHRFVADPVIMIAQLDNVLEAERGSNVAVQLIPFSAGVPAAQDSNFVLLEFDQEANMAPIVFVEGLTANQYLERKADVARYREAVDYLRDSALSPHESRQRIIELREYYTDPQARSLPHP
jgi:transcriptional regulator with XRE-family HTH domain